LDLNPNKFVLTTTNKTLILHIPAMCDTLFFKLDKYTDILWVRIKGKPWDFFQPKWSIINAYYIFYKRSESFVSKKKWYCWRHVKKLGNRLKIRYVLKMKEVIMYLL